MRFPSALLLVFAVGAAFAQTKIQGESSTREPRSERAWAALEFLVGTWTGEGSGDPGQSTGGFSFNWELQKKILVRRSQANYVATANRPAYSHEDLTIIYAESSSDRLRATYFDNEGHVIRYAISVSDDGNAIVFQSDVTSTSPTYRFAYSKTGSTTMKLKFEVAPPGKPDSFVAYIEGSARRLSSK
jgi:hypothetical protein